MIEIEAERLKIQEKAVKAQAKVKIYEVLNLADKIEMQEIRKIVSIN